MTPITKEECLKDIIDGIESKTFMLCVVSVISVFTLFGKSYIDKSNTELFIIMILISIILILLFVLGQRILVKRIKSNNFFIVEDRLVQIKNSDSKVIKLNMGPGNTFSSLNFQCNGIYKISGTKKESYSKADYIATTYSAANDKFYLVMYNGKIIKCFNASYYVIDESEFEFDGGKYLPRKARTGDGCGKLNTE